jgi:hypothetical protein
MKSFRSSSQAKRQEEQSVVEHSVLAMRAAKHMSYSKQKIKTGRTVCHHLLQMISETDSRQPDPRVSRRYHRSAPRQQIEGQLLSPAEGVDLFSVFELGQNMDQAANDKQFSLAF